VLLTNDPLLSYKVVNLLYAESTVYVYRLDSSFLISDLHINPSNISILRKVFYKRFRV